jgi:predicted PurR-regulated permease PerM
MERMPWFRTLIVLLVIIAALYLADKIYTIALTFSDIIVLFFLAWLVSFTLRPLANSIQRAFRIPFPFAVSSVYLGLVVILVLSLLIIVPSLVAQVTELLAHSQDISSNITAMAINVQNTIQAQLKERGIQGVDLSTIFNPGELFRQIQSLVTLLYANTLNIVSAIGSIFFNLLLVLILSYYMMLDGDRFAVNVISLVPERYQKEAIFFIESVDRTFGGFMRGQLIQGFIYGLGTAVVMSIFNLPLVFVVSLAAGLSFLLPFIGPFLSMIPPLIIALFVNQHNLLNVLWVFLILLALQWITMYFIAPKVMSNSVGIHPVLVFLGLLVGARVAGVLGAIFGVPIVAVIYAMAIFFYNQNEGVRRRRLEKLAEIEATHALHIPESEQQPGATPATPRPPVPVATLNKTARKTGEYIETVARNVKRAASEHMPRPEKPATPPKKTGTPRGRT